MKTDVVKLVVFRLGDDLFAADIFAVERVLRYALPGVVPDVPPWIVGVLDHAGQVVPIVDMRRRMQLPDREVAAETRILVLNTKAGWVGAIVDAVREVAVVAPKDVSPPPALFRGLAAEFIRGIAKVGTQIVVVLDVDRVLTSNDRIAFERAVTEAGARA